MTSQRRLPLIPLSPLISTSSEYAKLLAEIAQSLTVDNNTPQVKTSLEKNMIKEREKLDRLLKNMQAVQNSVLENFTVNEVAKEIAYIDSSLFRMVSLNEQWLCHFDKQSNIVPLVDFHRYLSHSVAHQVIMSIESIKNTKKKQANIICDLIQIAYILLHIYRDFSGCTAIVTGLHMPEVQRLESIWSTCPPKLLSVYKELEQIISPQNGYVSYYQQLSLHMSPFLSSIPHKSQMIAVPFMHAHLHTLHSLARTHSSVRNDIVLSNTGQQILSSCVHILKFCQHYSSMDPSEFERFADLNVHQRRRSIKRHSSIRLSLSPCLDLDPIRSNQDIYHWLVSRAYLSRHQLYIESLNVEPLAVGEIELEPEEEHDIFWDFFKKESPPKPKRQRLEVENLEIASQAAEEPNKPQKDDVIVLPEDDDDEEEEWTGYPRESSPSIIDDDEEEEEWTGYPIQDEEEDEEEIWRGYPIPQESPVELSSSPSTPPQDEDWQQKNDLWNNRSDAAIGKAAARRMQYSVSNTDTARKPLPPPFAPSTST